MFLLGNDQTVLHELLAVLGLLLYLLVTGTRGQRRHPSTAFAWVLGMIAFPYLAIPLFLAFGTRKFVRPSPARDRAPATTGVGDAAAWAVQVLHAVEVEPPVASTAARFHDDGDAALEALLGLIASATRSLDLCTYLFAADRIGRRVSEALRAAAARGVRVRVLADAIGSRVLSGRGLHLIGGSGTEVRFFMPLTHNPVRGRSNLRIHRKLAIADGKRLWAGGRNIAAEYFTGRGRRAAWVDLSYSVAGGLAVQAARQFERDWRHAGGRGAAAAGKDGINGTTPAIDAAGMSEAETSLAQWIPSGPDRAEDTLYAFLLAAAFHARREILAVTPYFVPDDSLIDAWCLACRRGVRVRLVIPRRSDHRLADIARNRDLRRLVREGAEVRLVPGMLHAKAVVIDEVVGLCGSANLDSRSLFLNFEAMAAFYGEAEIRWLREWFERQLKTGRPYAAREPGWPVAIVEGLVRSVGFQL